MMNKHSRSLEVTQALEIECEVSLEGEFMSSAVASAEALFSGMSPNERVQLLGSLIKICGEDGTIGRSHLVRDENGRLLAYMVDFFPPTKGPPPVLTAEEQAELKHRIDNRRTALSHDQFIAEVRRLRSETSGTK